MINIDFENIATDKSVRETLQKAAETAITESSAEITIVVCDDKFIQKLNKEYRNIDQPTDVLSFPSNETDLDDGNRYLGDIIISLPRATTQANEANHPVEEELAMLAIHGGLHLLGYDHLTQSDKQRRWEKQATVYIRKECQNSPGNRRARRRLQFHLENFNNGMVFHPFCHRICVGK